MSTNAPIIVFGEGSASVFLIAQLVKRNESVVWVNGSGAKLTPVMPYLTHSSALGAMLDSLAVVSEEGFARPMERGTFHRVFRNKGFKLASWKRSTNLATQQQAFEEMVWAPEQAFLGTQELRMAGLSPARAEEILRDAFENHALVKKVQSAPVIEFEVFDHGGKIQFANGFLTEFKAFYFCDALSELKAIPKLASVFKHPLSGVKTGDLVNALQVTFHHSVPLNQSLDLGLVIPMNRDAGETFDRDVLGYFLDPSKSVWTVFLQPEECEENHDIMKKLRKMKQSLNRAFDNPEFLPEGKKDFLSTIEKEFFRFEANCLVTAGAFKASKSNSDFTIISDAFGLSKGLQSIAELFQIEPVEFQDMTLNSDSANMDLDGVEALKHDSEHSA